MKKKIVEITQNSNKDKNFDYNALTSQQQANCSAFLAETMYLDDMQLDAIDRIIPMSQEIFDGIMQLREVIGPELDQTCMRVFLEYPAFAQEYATQIDMELEQINDLGKKTLPENQLSFEKIKMRLRKNTMQTSEIIFL